MIQEGGDKGRLRIDFDKLEYFGTPDETRVIYAKLKEDGD